MRTVVSLPDRAVALADGAGVAVKVYLDAGEVAALATARGAGVPVPEALRPALTGRPVRLLHGDLQAEHVLVDPASGRLSAFLDLADVQPGDPLLDVAVLTLWDEALAEPVLAGYGAADSHLLAAYRLLRHLAMVPWLLDRGLTGEADRSLRCIAR